ncbi:hypothetical protein OEA41_004438 [Lepraria neglecta]|uniref:Uncharacterized protein n=1 Tax=Lepraria neglecta TaxID=209136 RepID=A0AAD9Z113_9LECA|nr:hypothetical protein OEA41_004438 [Lepraria neglecta]
MALYPNPLPSTDIPPASGNRSTSRNTQDSSTPENKTTVKSRRNRRYSDAEGNGRTAGSADRKRLASTRPGVGHDTRKAEPSPRNDLHPSSPHAPTGLTAERDGATGKLNGKRRHSNVDGAENVSASESRRQNLPASTRPGLRQSASSGIKKEFPWRIYDGGYDLRVGGLVTVAKKKRPVSEVAEAVAIRKLSGLSRNDSLSTLFQVQGEYFVKCTEAYESGADLYIVLEHIPISLVQVVAAPAYPGETHVAAIVGQVRFQPVAPHRRR